MSEPFQKIQIDCGGHLNPTSKGKMYLLTIMCTAARYPEAFPLRNIKARSICNALKTLFCQRGLPKVIQSERYKSDGNVFKQLTEEFGIKHVLSSAYKPGKPGCSRKISFYVEKHVESLLCG